MRIKADWLQNLHKRRRREIYLIFKNVPHKVFREGLEVGAGDGFQSELLLKYIKKIVSTDYNSNRLSGKQTAGIEYMECDAEEIDRYFEARKFNIVFSSNLLEHLLRPEKTLRGMHKILKEDGIMIHSMPNSFWKFLQVAMFYPNLFANIIEKLTVPGWLWNFIRKMVKKEKSIFSVNMDFDNNPKTGSGKLKLLYPQVHGICKNHIEEFLAFRKRRWMKLFDSAGFTVIKVIKGSISSGYGFGFDSARKILENIGLSSWYAYVTVKKGATSPQSRFFL